MKVFYTNRRDHEARLHELLAGARSAGSDEVRRQVWSILEAVRQGGDAVLFHYAERLDRSTLTRRTVRITESEADHLVRTQADPRTVASLRHAADRIRMVHENQRIEPFQVMDQNGMRISQRVRPLARVGIYVPGGKANYPSSVLMAAIPAQVAGVPEVVMVTPVPDNRQIDAHVLAAARIAGVTEIYRVGGAHAIAALAYGTDSIARVDKIVGPGNAYVDMAKRLLYGVVDIDMTAGPSEVVILADSTAPPKFLAADLLAQAEHDEDARAILLLVGDELVESVSAAITAGLAALPRERIAKKAFADAGAIVVCRDLPEAVALADRLAPEHLQIIVADPAPALQGIHSAGAIFIGRYTPAALGDYVAGTNHILPTAGSARFFSPLSVYDFLKRTSVVLCSKEALSAEGPHVIQLATAEDLPGHAAAVRVRIEESEG
jgi:histidinol dehydrogenase